MKHNLLIPGKYMVYESGCQGLVVAGALERLGVPLELENGNPGKLIQVFHTGNPQTQSLNAMNFEEDILKQLVNLNIHHLRSLEQGHDITQMHDKVKKNYNSALLVWF